MSPVFREAAGRWLRGVVLTAVKWSNFSNLCNSLMDFGGFAGAIRRCSVPA